MVVAESDDGIRVRIWKWNGYWSAYAELGRWLKTFGRRFLISSGNIGRPMDVGRPVVGRPLAGGRPVPGRFRARDERLGFMVEVAKLVKSEQFCGWKWWR